MSKTTAKKPVERRIKFLSRDLPFPTDPTYREYRKVEELTGVDAQSIMTGEAGAWMLPILGMIALMRADRNVTHETLDKLMDLRPQDFEITGLDLDDDDPEKTEVPLETPTPTGTESTDETPDGSGTQESSTTSD